MGNHMTLNVQSIEHWACTKAQEIVLREGYRLIRSARDGNNTEIRENSLNLAKIIAASLLEAKTPPTSAQISVGT